MPLFLSDGAEGDGSGDVGGSVGILGTAVEQQQTFRTQGDIRLWCRLIMHNGTMSLIARYRIEGNIAEALLFGP